MFMEIKTVSKVTAYITRLHNNKRQLLVFKEQGYEHLGLQVPGGTVEENEDLLSAVQREIHEEAGINDAANIILLGEYTYYLEKLKSNVKRYYFQMNAACPDQFTHIVQSNDEDNGWIYNYHWFDLDEKPTLFGYLGVHLDKVL